MNNSLGSTSETTKWTQLLVDAVQKPGIISEAFHAFHGYSLGNRVWVRLLFTTENY